MKHETKQPIIAKEEAPFEISFAEIDDKRFFLMNALDEEKQVKAQGNYFTFKPKQVKEFVNGHVAEFIEANYKQEGIVSLPSQMSDSDFRKSEEGKALIQERIKLGIQNRIDHLTWMVNNLLVSLQHDMDMKEIKANVMTQASKGEVAAMKELKNRNAAIDKGRAEEVAELQALAAELKNPNTKVSFTQ